MLGPSRRVARPAAMWASPGRRRRGRGRTDGEPPRGAADRPPGGPPRLLTPPSPLHPVGGEAGQDRRRLRHLSASPARHSLPAVRDPDVRAALRPVAASPDGTGSGWSSPPSSTSATGPPAPPNATRSPAGEPRLPERPGRTRRGGALAAYRSGVPPAASVRLVVYAASWSTSVCPTWQRCSNRSTSGLSNRAANSSLAIRSPARRRSCAVRQQSRPRASGSRAPDADLIPPSCPRIPARPSGPEAACARRRAIVKTCGSASHATC
jgi:hypothetical protein